MISIILSVVIQLLNYVITFILSLVFAVFPVFDFSSFASVYSSFFNILGRGLNLLYFLCGSTVFIYADILLVLFTLKHIVLPVVNFTRKIIIK